MNLINLNSAQRSSANSALLPTNLQTANTSFSVNQSQGMGSWVSMMVMQLLVQLLQQIGANQQQTSQQNPAGSNTSGAASSAPSNSSSDTTSSTRPLGPGPDPVGERGDVGQPGIRPEQTTDTTPVNTAGNDTTTPSTPVDSTSVSDPRQLLGPSPGPKGEPGPTGATGYRPPAETTPNTSTYSFADDPRRLIGTICPSGATGATGATGYRPPAETTTANTEATSTPANSTSSTNSGQLIGDKGHVGPTGATGYRPPAETNPNASTYSFADDPRRFIGTICPSGATGATGEPGIRAPIADDSSCKSST